MENVSKNVLKGNIMINKNKHASYVANRVLLVRHKKKILVPLASLDTN